MTSQAIAAEHQDMEALLDHVTLEYMKAIERQERPNRERLLRSHPQIANELRVFFNDFDAVEKHAHRLQAGVVEVLPTSHVTREELLTAAQRYGATALADYEIGAVIAQGATASVFRAWQKSLNRPVALKVVNTASLHPESALPLARAEAEATAHLAHPNVVPIYEVGSIGPYQFFSMKLVEEGTLADCIEQYLGRPRKVAGLIVKVAQALQHAHERGILHRDVKLSNILIDASGEPCLTDFGLAGRVESGSRCQEPRWIVGTPRYMAPEQAAGAEMLTTAVDVYGLGAAFYELLTGELPFSDPLDRCCGNGANRHAPRSARISRPEIPRDLAAICSKCLQFEAEDRYGSAAELAADLELWLGGFPVQARPCRLAERMLKWVDRRPLVAFLAATAALFFVIGLGGITYQWRVAVAERERAEQATWRALQANESLQQRSYVNLIALADRALQAGDLAVARRTLDDWPLQPRGWEYAHLTARTNGHEPVVLQTHHTGVLSLAVDSSGHLIAAGSRGQLLVNDTTRPGHTLSLQQSQKDVNALAFRPDTDNLLAARADGVLSTWDLATGRLAAETRLVKEPIYRIAITHDSSHCVTVDGSESNVSLCHLGIDHSLSTLQRQVLGRLQKPVRALAMHPQQDWFVTGGDDFSLRFWKLDGTSWRPPLQGHGSPVEAVSFAADGSRFASISQTELRVWDATSLKLELVIEGGGTDVAFSPDGTRLAISGSAAGVRICDAQTGLLYLTLRDHTDIVTAVAFDPVTGSLYTGSRDRTVRFWNATPGAPPQRSCFELRRTLLPGSNVERISSPQYDRHLVELCRGGTKAVGVCEDGTVRLWDLRSGSLISQYLPRSPITTLRSCRGGDKILLVDRDNHLLVWEPGSGITSELNLESTAEPLNRGISCDPSGTRVATTTGRERTVIRLGQGDRARQYDPLNYDIFGAVWSPDGSWIASADERHQILLTDPQSLTVTHSLAGMSGEIRDLAFSDDGSRVAAGGYDRQVIVWDVATRKSIFAATAHAQSIVDVALSPDGKLVASAGEDELIHLWRVDSGEHLARLSGHLSPVLRVRFTPDSGELISLAEREDAVEVKHWRVP